MNTEAGLSGLIAAAAVYILTNVVIPWLKTKKGAPDVDPVPDVDPNPPKSDTPVIDAFLNLLRGILRNKVFSVQSLEEGVSEADVVKEYTEKLLK